MQCGAVAERIRAHRDQCRRDGLDVESGYAILMAVRLAGMAQAQGGGELSQVCCGGPGALRPAKGSQRPQRMVSWCAESGRGGGGG